METFLADPPVRPLDVVGGNLALDFANTVDDPYGPVRFDHIENVPRLLRWGRTVQLLSEPEYDELAVLAQEQPAVIATGLRRAHGLRRAVQSVFGAIAIGQPIPEQPWRDLRRWIAEAIGHADLTGDHADIDLVWRGGTLDAMLWPIAYAAHGLLTGTTLGRVKRCAACPWLYVDQSKNSSRRWCTMDDCGKNEKMRRYVERRAAKRRAAS
jgi:predicted RNA-binding Zn ribbon-like protein